MTPTEKAQDLVKSFMPYMYCYMGSGMLSNDYNLDIATRNARQSALIAVDETMEEIREFGDTNHLQDRLLFWGNVKQEINKL